MSDNLRIRQGARLSFVVEQADPDSISATFIAKKDATIIENTVNYDADGKAFFHFDSPDTDIVGEYEYQINENFSTGSPDIYPSDGDCLNGDCELPILEICESLEVTS